MKISRRRISPLLIGLLPTLALTFTPLFPSTRGWWDLTSQSRYNAFLATMMGIYFLLFSVTAMTLILSESDDQKRALAAIADRIPTSVIKWISDVEFYREFRNAIEGAKHSVRIAYLAPTPPYEGAPKERLEYYEWVLTTMQKRPDLRFFRLIRKSEANLAWISELLRECEGASNVDISVIEDELSPSNSMPLALSVQVVDETKSWLVAIEGHERRDAFRDVYVENAAFANAMSKYFDRVSNASVMVLENGKITVAGARLAEEAN